MFSLLGAQKTGAQSWYARKSGESPAWKTLAFVIPPSWYRAQKPSNLEMRTNTKNLQNPRPRVGKNGKLKKKCENGTKTTLVVFFCIFFWPIFGARLGWRISKLFLRLVFRISGLEGFLCTSSTPRLRNDNSLGGPTFEPPPPIGWNGQFKKEKRKAYKVFMRKTAQK